MACKKLRGAARKIVAMKCSIPCPRPAVAPDRLLAIALAHSFCRGWVIDVVFREDDCRVRKGHAARNLSAIRKFALSELRNDKTHSDRSLRRRRKLADRRPDYRADLLGIKPHQ